MATDRHLVCSSCGNKEWAGRLLDALFDRSNGDLAPCKCGGQRYVEVVFPLGLGAGARVCKVLCAFRPEQKCDAKTKWHNDENGTEVTFYPFLVLCEWREGETARQMAWLPYWHTETYPDGRIKPKYGQWGPQMDSDIFANLIDQVRRAGFVT